MAWKVFVFYICNFFRIGVMGNDAFKYKIYLTNLFVAKMVKGKVKDVETEDYRTEWKDPIEVQTFCVLCDA